MISMKFNKGDIVYRMPIRFWEEKEPIKHVVAEDKKTGKLNLNIIDDSNDWVLVYSEVDGHNVYIGRRKLFTSEENCRKAIELYSQLHDLYFSDESGKIAEEIIRSILKENK